MSSKHRTVEDDLALAWVPDDPEQRGALQARLAQNNELGERCPDCGNGGWVLDAKVDRHPTTLELLPCIRPDCPASGRTVAVFCVDYLKATEVARHPRTGIVMSLSPAALPQEQTGEVR